MSSTRATYTVPRATSARPIAQTGRRRCWAGDDEPDTFRIRLWTEDASGVETDVYDNEMNQPIGGGRIVIHAR